MNSLQLGRWGGEFTALGEVGGGEFTALGRWGQGG